MVTITTSIPYNFDEIIGYNFILQSKYINMSFPSSKFDIINNLPKEATFKIIGDRVYYYIITSIKPEGYIITPKDTRLVYENWDGWQYFDEEDISKLYRTKKEAIEAAESQILKHCF